MNVLGEGIDLSEPVETAETNVIDLIVVLLGQEAAPKKKAAARQPNQGPKIDDRPAADTGRNKRPTVGVPRQIADVQYARHLFCMLHSEANLPVRA
jgi:hypothetical protein